MGYWLNSIKGVVLAVFILGFICPSFCLCHRTEFCDAVFLAVFLAVFCPSFYIFIPYPVEHASFIAKSVYKATNGPV